MVNKANHFLAQTKINKIHSQAIFSQHNHNSHHNNNKLLLVSCLEIHKLKQLGLDLMNKIIMTNQVVIGDGGMTNQNKKSRKIHLIMVDDIAKQCNNNNFLKIHFNVKP